MILCFYVRYEILFNEQYKELGYQKRAIVRSGIRTHAHRSGLRPERSALDRSAILTSYHVDEG